MRRTLFSVLLLGFILCPFAWAEEGVDQPASEPKVTGRFEEVGGQRILTLWGTPRERGFAHGYLMAERIIAGLAYDFDRALKPLLPLYNSLVKTVVVPRFQFSDEETEEIEGLFAGVQARLPEEKQLVPALERPIELVDLKALNRFGDWYGLGCSSLAVWGELTKDGKPLVGRNFDFPGFDLLLSQQVVVVRAPLGDRQGQVGVSHPGCIGTMTGMNADGVFVAIHDVRIKPPLEKALQPNVPRLLAVRRILEQARGLEACTQARDLVRSWPTLYGNNLMVVAPETKAGTVPVASTPEIGSVQVVVVAAKTANSEGKRTRPVAMTTTSTPTFCWPERSFGGVPDVSVWTA